MSRASFLTEPHTLTFTEEAVCDDPQSGEVRVRVHWCSACHSDLHVLDADATPPPPVVLGHEASGIVDSVGDGVTSVAPGDHVVLSIIGPCGHCTPCMRGLPVACENSNGRGGTFADGSTRLTFQDKSAFRAVRVGGYSELTVVPEYSVVKIDKDVPLDLASVVGCSVQTGYGAIVNVADTRAGQSVGVIGLGAVGISAVQAARIAGAVQIVAVDPLQSRRELALKLGATIALSPEEATAERVGELTSRYLLDVVVDTVTKPSTTKQAIGMAGSGGTVVVVGVAPAGQSLGIDATDVVLSQKRVVGCYLGNCLPQRDIPLLLDLWRRGLLDLESMVTNRRPLEELTEAFDDLRAGVGLRTAVRVAGQEYIGAEG